MTGHCKRKACCPPLEETSSEVDEISNHTPVPRQASIAMQDRLTTTQALLRVLEGPASTVDGQAEGVQQERQTEAIRVLAEEVRAHALATADAAAQQVEWQKCQLASETNKMIRDYKAYKLRGVAFLQPLVREVPLQQERETIECRWSSGRETSCWHLSPKS